MFMKPEHEPKPGQRFRDIHPGLFGRTGSEWIVQDVFVGTDGLRYARVVLSSDASQVKTLSVAVLTDRRRFASL
jgi:hypothetical protein